MDSNMTIRVIGSSHHLAPPSRLQEAVSQKERLLGRLVRLRTENRINGAILLATCNRLEVVLDVNEHPRSVTHEDLLGAGVALACHEFGGSEATQYLLRVATGLDSMVRGEDQILGQWREAFKQAQTHGLLSPVLRVLRTQLVATARETRQQTGLTKIHVSVASLAARQIEQSGQDVVVLGAAETGRLAVETLVKRGKCRITLVNRTASRAEALARHFGIEAMSLEEFLSVAETAPRWSGILAAVNSKQPLLDARHVRGMKMIVDVSMPSVIAENVRSVDGLTVLDLDAIAKIVQDEGQRRTAALDTAEDIVVGRARALHVALTETGGGTHLARIVEQHVETAMQELQSLLETKLRHLSDGDQDQVRQAVLRTTRRNAHLHVQDVRERSRA
jgi:glutamyl-tRNA reductase